MEVVEMTARIAAPADIAWRFSGDFANAELTKGYVARVEVSGAGLGATRVYHLEPHVGEGYVIERLERLDERDRILEYSMIDNGGIPWTGYRGLIQITPSGPDACMILIRTSFIPVDVEGKALAALSASNISQYFESLRGLTRDALAA